jgi:hypothetical protein
MTFEERKKPFGQKKLTNICQVNFFVLLGRMNTSQSSVIYLDSYFAYLFCFENFGLINSKKFYIKKFSLLKF